MRICHPAPRQAPLSLLPRYVLEIQGRLRRARNHGTVPLDICCQAIVHL
jgi:hypothetical protein